MPSRGQHTIEPIREEESEPEVLRKLLSPVSDLYTRVIRSICVFKSASESFSLKDFAKTFSLSTFLNHFWMSDASSSVPSLMPSNSTPQCHQNDINIGDVGRYRVVRTIELGIYFGLSSSKLLKLCRDPTAHPVPLMCDDGGNEFFEFLLDDGPRDVRSAKGVVAKELFRDDGENFKHASQLHGRDLENLSGDSEHANASSVVCALTNPCVLMS